MFAFVTVVRVFQSPTALEGQLCQLSHIHPSLFYQLHHSGQLEGDTRGDTLG